MQNASIYSASTCMIFFFDFIDYLGHFASKKSASPTGEKRV